MREMCKQCSSLIPASRMGKHLELKHNVQEIKDDFLENGSSDTASDTNAVESISAQAHVNNEGENIKWINQKK